MNVNVPTMNENCPRCGAELPDMEMDYVDITQEIWFDWQCPECGEVGRDYFKVTFDERVVYNEHGRPVPCR